MISFSAALELLLDHAPPLQVERVRIEHAAGRVLRATVLADRPFPPFDRVMMDGYALRAADLAIGKSFTVVGSAPAGKPMASVPSAPFTCLEVMTGAPVPAGADRIVPVEEITLTGSNEIRVSDSYDSVAARFIHLAGSDAPEGKLLLDVGVKLGSREIGVAASCGMGLLEVSKLPRIVVIATGDELVAVDETPSAHQIRQSNAHAICTALDLAGYPAVDLQVLPDDLGIAASRLTDALANSDWLILTGAVSKGSRDCIPGLLDQLACRCLFHGIAQRPGKPAGCWIGPAGQVIAALPGNPVSALTGLHSLVLPALAHASGLKPVAARYLVPAKPFKRLTGFTHHLPVIVEGDIAHPASPGNSGDFIGLLRSDGFVTLPPALEPADSFAFIPWF